MLEPTHIIFIMHYQLITIANLLLKTEKVSYIFGGSSVFDFWKK